MSVPTVFQVLSTLLSKVLVQVQGWFYLYLIIKLILSAITIPLLDQYTTKLIINQDYDVGAYVFMGIALLECIHGLHKRWLLDPYRFHLNAVSHESIEFYTLDKLEEISGADQKDLLKGDYQSKKGNIKWNLVHFVAEIFDIGLQLISLIGYAAWIGYQSPTTVLIYGLGIGLYITFSTIKFVEWSEYDANWDNYNAHRGNQYSHLIHNKGTQCHTSMAQSMRKHEEIQSLDQLYNIMYSEGIQMVFNVLTVVNCYFILVGNHNPAFIIIYMQYVTLLKSNLQFISGLVKKYETIKKEYNNYIKLFEKTIPKTPNVEQKNFFQSVEILSGSTFVREKELAIDIKQDICLKPGQIVYVSGLSGAGKTTFLDIVAGVINHSETNFQVKADQTVLSNGFENLNKSRIYVATDVKINSHGISVYDVVISNTLNGNATLVHQALEIAECGDFITEANLYAKNNKFSSGQLNRLKVARYMYDILVEKPTMVLLDEIADGVDPTTTLKIAQTLYAYFRSNQILCLVTTHLPYIQTLPYDQEIKLTKGVVTVA